MNFLELQGEMDETLKNEVHADIKNIAQTLLVKDSFEAKAGYLNKI